MATQLEDFLLASTLRVEAGSRGGTGFFIAPNLVVTSAHVIEDPANGDYPLSGVEVLSGGKRHAATVIRYASSPDPDLAVLETAIGGPPCAYLFESVRAEDRLYICGQGERRTDPIRLHTDHVEPRGPILALGMEVPVPLAGAPILNLRTGAVCGVVSSPGGPDPAGTALGTSVSVIGSLFPGVRQAHDAYHQRNPKWFDCQVPASTVFAARRQIRATERLCASPVQPFLVPKTGETLLALADRVALEELTGQGLARSPIDIRAALDRSRKKGRNLLVVGPTGSGRSSVLRSVGHWHARRFPNLGALDGAGVFPLLLRANALADDGRPVEDRIISALGTDGLPSEFLTDLAETPGLELLVMIDGVDEIQDKRDLAELVGFVGQILEHPGFGEKTQLLVTSRPSAAEHFRYSNFDVYEIQPLELDSIQTAARQWLGPGAPDFVKANPKLLASGLLASPLVLTVSLKLFEAHPVELPRQVVGLYGRLVAGCERSWREPSCEKRYGEALMAAAPDALGFLALELLRSATDMTRDWTLTTVSRFLEKHREQSETDAGDGAVRFLTFLAEDSFFLQSDGDRFYWSHVAFRDYFAASCLVKLFHSDGVAAREIRSRWFDSNWGRAPAYALELLGSESERMALIEEVLSSGRSTRLKFVARVIRDGADLGRDTEGRLIEALIQKARAEAAAADLPLSPEDPSALDLLVSLAHLDRARSALEGIASGEDWSRQDRERARAGLKASTGVAT